MITKIIAFIISLVTIFNSFFVSVANMFSKEEETVQQTEISVALENFENSLYDEDGLYIFNTIQTEEEEENEDGLKIDIHTINTGENGGGVQKEQSINVGSMSMTILTSLGSVILPYVKDYALGCLDENYAKYNDFFSSSEGVLYLINRLDEIDKQFRELTNLIEKNNIEQQLIDRNTLIDNLSSKTNTVFDTFVKYSSDINNSEVRDGLITIVDEWAHSNTSGVENIYAVTNLLKNITSRTTGYTYPELYDKYATYIYDWEHETYEYRDIARAIDNITLMKAYILLEFYYTSKIDNYETMLEDDTTTATTEIELYATVQDLNQLITYANDYKEIMEANPVVSTEYTQCYITGLEHLCVEKRIGHFDYVAKLYNKRDYWDSSDYEGKLNLFNDIYNDPFVYYNTDYSDRYITLDDFEYLTKEDYQTMYDYYQSKGMTLIEGLTASGFEGLSEDTCFVFETDKQDILQSDSGTGWRSIWYRNVKFVYNVFKSNQDYCDIYCFDNDGNYKWHSCCRNIQINVYKNDGKGLSNFDSGNNFSNNRPDWDFCSFILA